MKIAAPHLANLLEFASTLGFDIVEIKNSFLSDPNLDLSLSENWVSEEEIIAVVNELTLRSGDKNFGLHYGFYMNLKALGLIYEISKTATEIGQAFSFLQDFLEKTFPVFKVNILNRDKKTIICLACTVKDKHVSRHLADASLTIMYRELKIMAGKEDKIEIYYPEVDLLEYKNLLGSSAKEGTDYALHFDSNIINSSLSDKNINRMAELLPSFLQLAEQNSRPKKFSDSVRKMTLNMCTPELPEMEKVASQFCMSPRSFQRKLAKEGKPFRALTNEIKRDLSIYLQKNERLQTQEIALLLGYSGSSAYLHAIKKWQGQT